MVCDSHSTEVYYHSKKYAIIHCIFHFLILEILTPTSPPVISTFSYWWSYSDTVNFLLFLGCWTTFVATPYLLAAPIYFPRLAHRFVIPAVEVITMIFWFSGFIAIGAQLPSPAYCTWSGCRALQAVTVFGAFEW